MSRIALAVLFLVASAPCHASGIDARVAHYEAMTRVAVRCSAPASHREIVVCGNRRADHWRVPFLLKEAGDPSIQNVPAERAALITRSTPCQDRGPFLVGCGPGVGVHVSTNFGPGSKAQIRPLAE